MSERVAIHYCPYCGDEDLEPHEDESGTGPGNAWVCRSCVRVFEVKFVGLRTAGAASTGSEQLGTGEHN